MAVFCFDGRNHGDNNEDSTRTENKTEKGEKMPYLIGILIFMAVYFLIFKLAMDYSELTKEVRMIRKLLETKLNAPSPEVRTIDGDETEWRQ